MHRRVKAPAPSLWHPLFVAALLWPAVASAQTTLRMGYELSPPMQLLDEAGRPSGPIHELLALAAQRRKIQLEWVHAPEGPDRALAAGKVNLWPLIADLPERQRAIRISPPYMRIRFWLVSREGSGIGKLADTVGRRVARLRGRIFQALLERYTPGAVPVETADFGSAVRSACYGETDAALVAQGTGDYLFLKDSGCEVGRLNVLPLPGAAVDFGLGARRGDNAAEAAALALQEELMRLFDEGVFSAIYLRWGVMSTETRMLSDYLLAERKNRVLIALAVLMVLALAAAVWQGAQNRRRSLALQQALAEVRHAQAMLVHGEKMALLGQMTAGLAHDINNPLAFVTSNHDLLARNFHDLMRYVSVLEESAPRLEEACPDVAAQLRLRAEEAELDYLKESIPRKLKGNSEGLERVRQLVVDLRAFSRLDEAEWKLCDLEESIEAALRFLQPLCRSQQVRIETRFAPVGMLWCSPSALNQAVSNVIANAIQASTAGSAVTLATELRDGAAVITVMDSGPGMPPEVLAKVFDPFFTTKPPGAGTGLGLSIAQQIVQQHGGTIRAASAAGQGACVTIQIPCARAAPAGRS